MARSSVFVRESKNYTSGQRTEHTSGDSALSGALVIVGTSATLDCTVALSLSPPDTSPSASISTTQWRKSWCVWGSRRRSGSSNSTTRIGPQVRCMRGSASASLATQLTSYCWFYEQSELLLLLLLLLLPLPLLRTPLSIRIHLWLHTQMSDLSKAYKLGTQKRRRTVHFTITNHRIFSNLEGGVGARWARWLYGRGVGQSE
jgi:hypothetical protein